MRSDVLVVEDDAASRDALVALLGLRGYATAAARNGAEALTYLDCHEPPRVILLDLMMPVMDGWHFLRARKGLPRLADIPVVLCTAEGSLDPAAARALGADDLLQKPADPDKLLDAVRRWSAMTPEQPAPRRTDERAGERGPDALEEARSVLTAFRRFIDERAGDFQALQVLRSRPNTTAQG